MPQIWPLCQMIRDKPSSVEARLCHCRRAVLASGKRTVSARQGDCPTDLQLGGLPRISSRGGVLVRILLPVIEWVPAEHAGTPLDLSPKCSRLVRIATRLDT
jgi:hypothetical protein